MFNLHFFKKWSKFGKNFTVLREKPVFFPKKLHFYTFPKARALPYFYPPMHACFFVGVRA